MLIRLSLAFKNYETSINQGPKSKCQNLLNVYIYTHTTHTYIYVCNISIYIYNLYIYRQSLSRIIFDLCGFSGAGLEITFGLRVMDSMTQLWCQKVGFSRLFCVILRHIFGPSKCDWQRVAHYFSVPTKKMPFLDVQVYLYIYKIAKLVFDLNHKGLRQIYMRDISMGSRVDKWTYSL